MDTAGKAHRRGWRQARIVAILGMALLGARAADRSAWDFTLPTLPGDRFVHAAKLSGPVLVNFWGRDCAPCVAELPRLQAFANANRGWTILLVCTDPPQEARLFLRRHRITLTALRAGADVAGLMRGAGNREGGLPFTVVLREGLICWMHQGGLSEAELRTLRAECGDNTPRP